MSLLQIDGYYVFRVPKGREDAGEMRESHVSTIVDVKTLDEGTLAAFIWLKATVENIKKFYDYEVCFPACIKTHTYAPGRLDLKKREVVPQKTGLFFGFEWKYDRGTSMEQETEWAERRMKEAKKPKAKSGRS